MTNILISQTEDKKTSLVFVNGLLHKSHTDFSDWTYLSLEEYLMLHIGEITPISITDSDTDAINRILDNTGNSYKKRDLNSVIKILVFKFLLSSNTYFAFIRETITDRDSVYVIYFNHEGTRYNLDSEIEILNTYH